VASGRGFVAGVAGRCVCAIAIGCKPAAISSPASVSFLRLDSLFPAPIASAKFEIPLSTGVEMSLDAARTSACATKGLPALTRAGGPPAVLFGTLAWPAHSQRESRRSAGPPPAQHHRPRIIRSRLKQKRLTSRVPIRAAGTLIASPTAANTRTAAQHHPHHRAALRAQSHTDSNLPDLPRDVV